MVKCIGCAVQKGELEVLRVFETEHFTVEQDYEIPIPGFMIIASKKHIKGIEDLNEKERKEFIDLMFKVRKAITKVAGIKFVYIIQKEDSIIRKGHFHFWLFPQYDWILKKFGAKISDISPAIEYAKETMGDEKNISKVKEVADKISQHLS